MLQGDFKEEISLEEVRGVRGGAGSGPHQPCIEAAQRCTLLALLLFGGHRQAEEVLPGHELSSKTTPPRRPTLSRPQATKLVVKVLSKTMDSAALSPDKVELATLSRDEAAGKVR